jgi:hypothetical protein
MLFSTATFACELAYVILTNCTDLLSIPLFIFNIFNILLQLIFSTSYSSKYY